MSAAQFKCNCTTGYLCIACTNAARASMQQAQVRQPVAPASSVNYGPQFGKLTLSGRWIVPTVQPTLWSTELPEPAKEPEAPPPPAKFVPTEDELLWAKRERDAIEHEVPSWRYNVEVTVVRRSSYSEVRVIEIAVTRGGKKACVGAYRNMADREDSELQLMIDELVRQGAPIE